MNNTVIDSCAFTGHWPFRKMVGETVASNAARAEKAKITHMVVSNLNAIFYVDPMEGNYELLEEVKAYKGNVKLLPFAVINPTYIEWERDLRECADLGFSGIQLAPQYHGYAPSIPDARKLYALCGELGLAVKIDMGFENIRQRTRLDVHFDLTGDDIAPLLSASAKTVTIISTSPSYALGASTAIINSRDNIFVNIIYFDSFTNAQLENALKIYTSKRLCFGTQNPFRYIDVQYSKLFAGDGFGYDITDEMREDILYGNLQGKIKGC